MLPDTVWSKADVHLHTRNSDGSDSVRELLGYVSENTDLRVIAVTDHDCVTGAHEARLLAPRYGLEVVVGQEVTTNRGHLLALYVEKLVQAGLSIPETVDAIHAQGGIAILAHPFDRICNSPMRHWPNPRLADWRSFRLDGLEAINGCQVDPRANSRALELGKLLGLTLTGGSDAHHRAVVGVAYTLFPGRTAADLRHSLEEGTTVAAGRRWSIKEYSGWLAKSFLPRTWRNLGQPVPAIGS